MRITNKMLQQGSLANIQSGLKGIADAQRKVSSGQRLQKASDDPGAAAGAMRARRDLRALDQYKRGVDAAESRADAEELVLDQLTDILTRAKQIAVSQAGANATPETRQYAKAEVDQLFRQIVGLANSQHEGAYLFGGSNATVRPYAVDETGATLNYTTTTPTGDHKVEISEQRYLLANHSGSAVFETTGVLDAVRDLAAALVSADPNAVPNSVGSLDDAFQGVQDLLGDLGARTNQLQLTRSSLEATELNLLGMRSDLEEVEVEEAMTELVGRQTSFQAAMLATSRVMGLTLADYLR